MCQVSMPGHSVPLSALGGLILVFGFLAQNVSMTLLQHVTCRLVTCRLVTCRMLQVGKHGSVSRPGDGELISVAATNTILATAMGGTSVLAFNKLLVDHQYSFLMVRDNCHMKSPIHRLNLVKSAIFQK